MHPEYIEYAHRIAPELTPYQLWQLEHKGDMLPDGEGHGTAPDWFVAQAEVREQMREEGRV